LGRKKKKWGQIEAWKNLWLPLRETSAKEPDDGRDMCQARWCGKKESKRG